MIGTMSHHALAMVDAVQYLNTLAIAAAHMHAALLILFGTYLHIHKKEALLFGECTHGIIKYFI